MPRDKLLIPVDFTGPTDEVIRTAATLAERLGADAVLLYVVRLPAGLPAGARLHPHGSEAAVEALAFLDEDARTQLEALAGPLLARGCAVEIAIEHGEIPKAIAAAAERVGAWMIVMGTHGRRGLRRWVEGSVAEQVIRRAPVPVVVVRCTDPDTRPGLSDAQRQALLESGD